MNFHVSYHGLPPIGLSATRKKEIYDEYRAMPTLDLGCQLTLDEMGLADTLMELAELGYKVETAKRLHAAAEWADRCEQLRLGMPQLIGGVTQRADQITSRSEEVEKEEENRKKKQNTGE
jgi:hypothetical protein